MALGARAAGYKTRELPLADGGEGTLDVLLTARTGTRFTTRVTGPLGDPVDAEWGMLPDGTAVIEMAKASGLALVGAEQNEPIRATTRGTGELLHAAVQAGATRALVAVGGSATVDGGLGALEALDWSLDGLSVVVACDVTTGFIDAAPIFGPQKGASEEDVKFLTKRLGTLADEYQNQTGVDVRRMRHAGAAGGLAGGLAAIGATLRAGFDVVAEAVDFHEALATSTLVLTGEGRLDLASLHGKVVGQVLERIPAEVHCGVIVGDLEEGIDHQLPASVALSVLSRIAGSSEKAIAMAGQLIRNAAFEIALSPGDSESRYSS